jgi:DNA mismatch repair protein MutS
MASTEPQTGGSEMFSILFDREEDVAAPDADEAPACFGDLHLDQILSGLAEGREEYRLAPLFYRPLHSVETVRYRHHVLRDLERDEVLQPVRSFAGGMTEMRKHLALVDKLHYARQKQRWFLAAVSLYCEVVAEFAGALAALELESPGLRSLREYLATYTAADAFTTLSAETQKRTDELAAITYEVLIRGNRVRVSEYGDETDVSEEVEHAFAKFRQGAVADHRVRFREYAEMNHVEAQILDLVAKLFPEPFAHLADYCTRHDSYLDDTIARFDREVQFYLGYLDYIAPLKHRGLAFSYPRVSGRSKEIGATATFDLSLATKLLHEDAPIVCNDFQLTGSERVLVVSGPNNGGKTTFARTFGQLHYLASLGLPVPGRDARLFLPDQIFTHFEREEDIETLRGKFEDELFRIHAILEDATTDSVLIMNESFGSTTLRDAIVVGTEVMKQIIELDVLCVFVTFVDELASLSDSTVSMMSTVVPDDPAVRTFKVVRKPADGLAYAAALAEKYGLTTDSLRRRIGS